MTVEYQGLPGADLVEEGLCDLIAGRETIVALLVALGSPRLRWLGLPVPVEGVPTDPDLLLYRRLAAEFPGDAHSRYNAWVRRLTRFERALEHQIFRRRRTGEGP